MWQINEVHYLNVMVRTSTRCGYHLREKRKGAGKAQRTSSEMMSVKKDVLVQDHGTVREATIGLHWLNTDENALSSAFLLPQHIV